MTLKGRENMLNLPQLFNILLLAIVSVAIYMTSYVDKTIQWGPQVLLQEPQTQSRNESVSTCNLFSGRWVYDKVSSPLYEEAKCPFLEDEFNCQKHGRKDLKYQNWRWQPQGCNLPRFDGTALLEKIQGKKLVFVGDSLNRNLWKSMLCLINHLLPASTNKLLKRNGNFQYFHVADYNATIGHYWAPLLVESNADKVKVNNIWPRIVRMDSIEKHGRHWTNANILVFNSFAWWNVYDMPILWGPFGSPDGIYTNESTMRRRYEMALSTWSDWLELQIDRTKTKLFFISPSPFRIGGARWGTDDSCYRKTEPSVNETYVASFINRGMVGILESAIERLEKRGLKVEYLNITQLSAYREDGHPSTFRRVRPDELPEGKWKDPTRFSDCQHWCLPGVPDTWSQILYAYIMKS